MAHHEMGHALVALGVPTADPLHRVSIIPRGAAALGMTMQRPLEDRYLLTEPELKDRLAILLGGRTAEEICVRADLHRRPGRPRCAPPRSPGPWWSSTG